MKKTRMKMKKMKMMKMKMVILLPRKNHQRKETMTKTKMKMRMKKKKMKIKKTKKMKTKKIVIRKNQKKVIKREKKILSYWKVHYCSNLRLTLIYNNKCLSDSLNNQHSRPLPMKLTALFTISALSFQHFNLNSNIKIITLLNLISWISLSKKENLAFTTHTENIDLSKKNKIDKILLTTIFHCLYLNSLTNRH